MKIIHISTHLGGGVGTVVRNWLKNDQKNEHTILLLNRTYYGKKLPIEHEYMRYEYDKINKMIEESDIVVIHFWNHPMLFEFLIKAKLPPARVIIWSHVSSTHPPYQHTRKLFEFADRFITSSPVSDIKEAPKEANISNIWTTGGIDSYLQVRKRPHNRFIVGYVGTLDYTKIHSEFINICERISQRIPNVLFSIRGTGCDVEGMQREIRDRKLSNIFQFHDYVDDIQDVIQYFDVFGYPLNPTHFGTCEQVLGEAMACGVEPVVLNNPSENFIVSGYGRVCNSIDEYIDNIVDVYKNPTPEGVELSLRSRAHELYDMTRMVSAWNSMFENIMKDEKRERSWGINNANGFDIFVESLGEYGKIIKYGTDDEIKKLFSSSTQWYSKNKGSVYQYIDAFPDDKKLIELSKI